MNEIFLGDISDPNEIAKLILDAVESSNAKQLEEVVNIASMYCFMEFSPNLEPFPDVVFDLILQLMTEERFLKMDDSHHLLMLFEFDWARLSESQKDRLLHLIGASYDKFDDWMSFFVISELLGQYYCNEAAFQVLQGQQGTSNETARSLVSHGFEHIVKDSQDTALRKKAMASLLFMRNDKSPKVRGEVEESLSHLSARRITLQSL